MASLWDHYSITNAYDEMRCPDNRARASSQRLSQYLDSLDTHALNARKNRVLLFAQAALPQERYQAFRKLFLGEFGRDGLERELERIIAGDVRDRDR